MNTTVWERIAEVPWWIYVIIGYLIYIQFLSVKSRTISVKQMATPAISMILMSCMLLTLQLTLHPRLVTQAGITSYLMGGVIIGLLFGWMQFRLSGIKLTDAKQLLIPGAKWPLLLFGVIALTGIYLRLNFDMSWILNPLAVCLSFALTMGLAIGRLTGLIYQTRVIRQV